MKNLIVLLFISMIVLASCNEDNNISGSAPDQLFRPPRFQVLINGTNVAFNWIPIANATYSLEYSKDSLLFNNELKTILIEEGSEYEVEDLSSNSRYSARIKAISKDSSIKNSEYNQITFKTGEREK